MQKRLELGKVDYNDRGNRVNRVTIEVKMEGGNLSVVGSVWNRSGSDILEGGQNIDTIAKLFPNDPKVQRIVTIWRRWHLNNMKAGTPAQETYLREHPVSFTHPDSYYEAACRALKAADLLVDNGYRFGTAWLKEELPADVVAEVESW